MNATKQMSKILKKSICALKRLRIPAADVSQSKAELASIIVSSGEEKPKQTCAPHLEPYRDSLEAQIKGPRSKSDSWKVISFEKSFPIVSGADRVLNTNPLDTLRSTVLRFENIYPPSVATLVGEWQLQQDQREMQAGDYFIQSIPLFPDMRPPLFAASMGIMCVDQVVHVYDTDEKIGATVVTTAAHDEIGEHTVWIRNSNSDDVETEDSADDVCSNTSNVLILESISCSRFEPHVFGPGLWYARWLQRRAHRLSQDHLSSQIAQELAKHNLLQK